MKIRIFREDLNDCSEYVILKDDKDFHYLINVLKVKNDESVFIFSNKIELECYVKIEKKSLQLIKIQQVLPTENKEDIASLAFILPVIKGDKMNLIARQIVEMGFGQIFIAKTEFSQSREQNYKESKFNSHLKEALEQSEGFYHPTVEREVCNLYKTIEKLTDYSIVYGGFCEDSIPLVTARLARDFYNNDPRNNVTSERENDIKNGNRYDVNPRMLSLMKSIKNRRKVAVLIGPEGGLSPREEEFLSSMDNCFPVNLGMRKLRCETASVCLMQLAKTLIL